MKMGIISGLGRMDQDKAAKYVGIGILVAIVFGSVLMVSKSVYTMAEDWRTAANDKATNDYDLGFISAAQRDLIQAENWKIFYNMRVQGLWVTNIAKVIVNLGLLLVFIGFVGLGLNASADEKTRRLFLTIAAIIIFIMLFTTFFAGVTVIVA